MVIIEGIGDDVLFFSTVCLVFLIYLIINIVTHVQRRRREPLSSTRDFIQGVSQFENQNSEPNIVNNESENVNIERNRSDVIRNNNYEELNRRSELNAERNIQIKLKYINDILIIVSTNLDENLQNVIRQNVQSSNRPLRLIHNGRELQSLNCTLEECGLRNNSVIHVIVQEYYAHRTFNNRTTELENLNLTPLMNILSGAIFAILWFVRFSFNEYFNPISSGLLIIMTLFYTIYIFRN